MIIAEINATSGNRAAQDLAAEFDPKRVCFIHTDVGDEGSVQKLYQEVVQHFGRVDVVINNATIAAIGLVKDLPIEQWDQNYRVNLSGPVLIA